MENVILVILLILALALIGAVLMQRSEGGGLGTGGGGNGGAMSGRAAATALGKVTWFLGGGFMIAAMAMTIISAQKSGGSSVIDRLSDQPAQAVIDETPAVDGSDLLPPTGDTNAPLVPVVE